MRGPVDAMGPERSIGSLPAASAAPDASSDAPSPIPVDRAADDRAMRRAALRDLAAMIGVEVFY